MTHFDKSAQHESHYNKAHDGKGCMDSFGGTIKRVVSGLVKSNKITINTVKKFAKKASKTVSSIQSI